MTKEEAHLTYLKAGGLIERLNPGFVTNRTTKKEITTALSKILGVEIKGKNIAQVSIMIDRYYETHAYDKAMKII